MLHIAVKKSVLVCNFKIFFHTYKESHRDKYKNMNFDNTKMILGNSEMFKPRADFQSIYNFKNVNH